jgi:hypothetical protein
MLNNLAFAQRACAGPNRPAAAAQEPGAEDEFLWFPKAGIGRVLRKRYVAYFGASKGGVLKVFDRRSGRLTYSDCGYLGTQRDGSRVASQHFEPDREVLAESAKVELTTPFVRIARPTMTPWLFLAFRTFSLTFGRSASLARWLKRLLVRVLIYRKQPAGMELRRTIEFGDDHVAVRDRVTGPGLGKLKDLRWLPAFTTIHMGSSRYFVDHELNCLANTAASLQRLEVRARSHIDIERSVRFDQV